MNSSSLKRKFIIFTILIITPIATSNIICLYIGRRINNNYNSMLNKLSILKSVKMELDESLYNYEKYIRENDYKSIEIYNSKYKDLMQKINFLQTNSDIESRYVLRDLKNCIESYKKSADYSIKLNDEKASIDVYYINYVETKEIYEFCNSFIAKLNDSYLNYNNKVYLKLKSKENFIYKILAMYIISAILISIFYCFFFINSLLLKLKELLNVANRVSKKDFTTYNWTKSNIYEIDILSETFCTMINDIKKYINSIKENAELEKKLKDEEMKILTYENALKMSQLKILQSQINPHFLFNTLNCINQTAIRECAEETQELIKSVSDILRYSLSMMNRNATLEQEVNIVQQYMNIQLRRYEDRLKFNIDIKADISNIKLPGMTLQPFVENAFIHGIEPKEEGGVININIFEKDDRCIVMIEDNGCGIEKEILSNLRDESYEKEHTGHTTGLGIKSVVKRLQIMYGIDDIFSIESQVNEGTRVFLKIPKRGMAENV